MKKTAMLAVFFLTPLFVFAYSEPFYMPRPDGEYDNYNILVNPREMSISRMMESVVRISAIAILKSDEREFYHQDFGFVGGLVIPGKYIISAAHLVSLGDVIETETPFGILKEPAHKVSEVFIIAGNEGRSSIQLKLVYLNRGVDVAIFELPDDAAFPSFPYALGKSASLKVGNYVYILGYPLGLDVNVRDGIVNALRMPAGWNTGTEPRSRNDFFMVSVGVVPNDSGTAIVAIRDGAYELVGIASSMANYNNLGVAVRLDAIREVILAECAECPEDLKRFFGEVAEAGNEEKLQKP